MDFRDSSSLSDHRKAKHKNSVYVCPVCAQAFHMPSSLKYHMRMRHNEVALDMDKVRPIIQGNKDSINNLADNQEDEMAAAVAALQN
jgi:hypothetical protein